MPFTTLFATVKLGFNRVEEKLSVLARGLRVAVSISTSAGELTRVGTWIVRVVSESRGKTWYNSTSTWLILASGIVLGTISPVITAWLMTVVSVRAKSSAVSVSIFPGLGRRDSAPSRPSGLPVLKKKCSAHAGSASPIPIIRIAVAKLNRDLMIIIFVLLRFSFRLVCRRVIPGMNWEWNINLGSFRRRMRAGGGCGWDDEVCEEPLLRSAVCALA